MLYSYVEEILLHALNLIFYYQINSIHAVLASEILSWESPWRPSRWNS